MRIPPDDIFTDFVSLTDDVSEHSGPSRTYLSHVWSLYTAFRMSKIGQPIQSSDISGNASNMLGEHIHCTWALIRFQRLKQFKYASELNTFTYFHNKSRCMNVIRLSNRISVQCDHSPSRSNPTNNDVCLTLDWHSIYLRLAICLSDCDNRFVRDIRLLGSFNMRASACQPGLRSVTIRVAFACQR